LQVPLDHLSILTWAETTAAAGYTSDEGHKVGVAHPQLSPRIIIYDGDIASYTPNRLWLSSGMRAVDHAIEMLYNPRAAETPHRLLSLSTCHELFRLLPQSKADPENKDIRQRLQIVAFGTLFSISYGGGLGLSHSMGTPAS
jgi:3-oxoacid CoA-transferase